MRLLGRIFCAALLCAGISTIGFAQTDTTPASDQGAKQDMKDAGHSTKRAAKKTGRKVKRGTKRATNKAARKTEQGAEKVEDKTQP
ncbi:MAG: hypothetical protein M3O09_13680 [Acidobacteriota bacterium]|jgi:hypothetical protein|nr:hypothetical protein [Acidobacteriota bacterium]